MCCENRSDFNTLHTDTHSVSISERFHANKKHVFSCHTVKLGKTDWEKLLNTTQNSGHERIKKPEAQTLISNPYAFSESECICVESLETERMTEL